MARDSREAANKLVAENFRSAVARAYFAAFAFVTHRLVQGGAAFPGGWDAPAHRKIRPLIESMSNMNPGARVALSQMFGRLHILRINADYKPSIRVEAREAREALAIMRKIFEVS